MRREMLSLFGGAMLTITTAGIPYALAQENGTKPDNTAANKSEGATAQHQSENKSEREVARRIRKAIVADKSLSTYAHNVKIIAANGVVTLRGPVRSEDEKSAVEAKARSEAGANEIRNELSVAPKNK